MGMGGKESDISIKCNVWNLIRSWFEKLTLKVILETIGGNLNMDHVDHVREFLLLLWGMIMGSQWCKSMSLFQELYFKVLGVSDMMSVTL